MTSLPGWRALYLAPDGRVEILIAIEIAANPIKHVALAGELIEGGLILCGREAMAGNPGTSCALFIISRTSKANVD